MGLDIRTVFQLVLISSFLSSFTLAQENAKLSISNGPQFRERWSGSDSVKDGTTWGSLPDSDGEIWYIKSDSHMEIDYSFVFNIPGNRICEHTRMHLEISCFSVLNSAVLWPLLDKQGIEEYYRFEVSRNNLSKWDSHVPDIDISKNEIIISGILLPGGYFLFDEIAIVHDGKMDDECDPTTTPSPGTTVEITTEADTSTPAEEVSETWPSTSTTTPTTSTTLGTTVEITTESAEVEPTEEEPNNTSEPTTIEVTPPTIASTTTTMPTTTKPSTTTSTTTIATTSPATSTTTIATTPPATPTTTITPTPPTTSTTISSTISQSSTSTTVASTIPSTSTSPALSTTTSFRTTSRSTSTSTKLPITTHSTVASTSVSGGPLPSTTTRKPIPGPIVNNSGLSTTDIILYIVLPSLVVLTIISLGFGFAYYGKGGCCKGASEGNRNRRGQDPQLNDTANNPRFQSPERSFQPRINSEANALGRNIDPRPYIGRNDVSVNVPGLDIPRPRLETVSPTSAYEISPYEYVDDENPTQRNTSGYEGDFDNSNYLPRIRRRVDF